MKKALIFLSGLLWALAPMAVEAAVENVKVSGDVTIRGLWRESYSLGGIPSQDTYNGSIFSAVRDEQRFFMSQVRLRTNADLTENISGEIELLNQRDLDSPAGGQQGGALASGTLVLGTAPSAVAGAQFDVLLNLANITVKELYFEPLSVRIGRQNLQWGEGFILGTTQLANPDPSNVISADEFSQFTSFDAARVMWNKENWWVDGVGIKGQENAINRSDDATSFGINTGRKFTRYQSEAEFYFLGSHDAGLGTSVSNSVGDTFVTTEKLYNFGIRGSLRPIERLKLSGENVVQWGKEGGSQSGANCQFTLNGCKQQDVMSWAFDYRAELTVKELPWPTNFGMEWVFYSGEDENEDGKSGAYRLMHRGKFHSLIREFQGQFYITDASVTAGFQNQHQLLFDAVFHPFNRQDTTLILKWLLYWLDEVVVAGRDKYLGNELNAILTHAYTEDLSFMLIGAMFFPGEYFRSSSPMVNAAGQGVGAADEVARELVASVTLNF